MRRERLLAELAELMLGDCCCCCCCDEDPEDPEDDLADEAAARGVA